MEHDILKEPSDKTLLKVMTIIFIIAVTVSCCVAAATFMILSNIVTQ